MTPDFKSYLATQVIAEKQTVSYRKVSRALKVHVNSAKCMLYEFWEKENKRIPGSVYATYLIAGTKKREEKPASTNGHAKDEDGDDPMPSNPPFTNLQMDMSQRSQRPEPREIVPVKSISLVREENLETIKAQHDDITSIHIYSLSPGRLGDLMALIEISRGLFADHFVKEDPLTNNKTYGVIQNPDVRRRKGRRPVIPSAVAPKFQPVKEEKAAKKEISKSLAATNNSKDDKETSRPGSRDSSTSASSTKQPTLKRDGSNLFKAFAKAQNKPKLNRDETTASTNASLSGHEDVKMADADEADHSEEEEDDSMFLDTGTTKPGNKKRSADIKKEREDKQAKLRKMMDSDDEDEKAVPNIEDATNAKQEPVTAQQGGSQAETADDENDDVAWSDSDTEKQRQTAPAKDASATAKMEAEAPISIEPPKRRRGKRKVMKKRTMKDEEGFLVTKEEAVWESFSEDEPEPVVKTKEREKDKPKTAFYTTSQPASSSQKSSTAGSQGGTQTQTQKKRGDITSFFGRK